MKSFPLPRRSFRQGVTYYAPPEAREGEQHCEHVIVSILAKCHGMAMAATDPHLATCQEDRMNRLRGITMVIGLCAALVSSSAWAESSLFVGRWHLNRVQSMLPPGDPVPKDVICDISRADGNHVKWSVTVLTTEGRRHVETFDTVANGEFYPISSETTASFRLTGDTLQATFDGPTGQSDAQTCILSADHKQMICRGVLTEGDGRTVNYVDVYDRM